MRTIGRHVSASRPRGESTATCDYCGNLWPRSKLREDGDGRLACPDENGRTGLIEKERENAAYVAARIAAERPVTARRHR